MRHRPWRKRAVSEPDRVDALGQRLPHQGRGVVCAGSRRARPSPSTSSTRQGSRPTHRSSTSAAARRGWSMHRPVPVRGSPASKLCRILPMTRQAWPRHPKWWGSGGQSGRVRSPPSLLQYRSGDRAMQLDRLGPLTTAFANAAHRTTSGAVITTSHGGSATHAD